MDGSLSHPHRQYQRGQSEDGSVLDYRMARAAIYRSYTTSDSSLGEAEGGPRYRSEDGDPDLMEPPSPPHMSSPSQASSIDPFSAAVSPLRRDLSRTTFHDEPEKPSSPSRVALARRLTHLAQQLTTDDDVDEAALTCQLDQLEQNFTAHSQEPLNSTTAQRSRPGYLGLRSQSDQGGALLNSSVPYHGFPAHHRALSYRQVPLEGTQERQPEKRLSIRQVNKIVAEATKLNEELTIVVSNLRARQEESDVGLFSAKPATIMFLTPAL